MATPIAIAVVEHEGRFLVGQRKTADYEKTEAICHVPGRGVIGRHLNQERIATRAVKRGCLF